MQIDFTRRNPLANVRVLIADDDRRIGLLVQSVLQGLGFQHVTVCHDGSEALEILRDRPVDFLICDWQMEPLSGVNLVRYVRQSPDSPNRRLPIIMLSGHAERAEVEEARDVGVTEYVVKPFTAKSLCSRIMALIDAPREFVLSPHFVGPNRRRRQEKVDRDRRKN